MRGEYTLRRNVCCRAIDKYLPRETIDFTVPAAGMFFWIRIKVPTEMFAGMNGGSGSMGDKEGDGMTVEKGVGSLGERIFQKCIEEGVLLVPGDVFRAEEGKGDSGIFFRGTFAAVPFDKLEIGIQRFGKVLREIFHLPSQ
jgi:aromatic amino acid aminotransferase I / 2-aminoadipate transaminase